MKIISLYKARNSKMLQPFNVTAFIYTYVCVCVHKNVGRQNRERKKIKKKRENDYLLLSDIILIAQQRNSHQMSIIKVFSLATSST